MISISEQIKSLVQDVQSADESPYEQVVSAVTETATALSEELKVAGLSFAIEVGHRVSMGQQYKFVVSLNAPLYKDTFFRFYVPGAGFPTILQLFEDESIECNSVEALKTAVIEFLNRAPVKQRLRSLISMAKVG